jgi:RNA polymerase sigma-70 factor (ECF subfamily)
VKAVAAGGRGTSEALNDREQLLMARVAGGDSAAFAELFDGQSPIILGFLVRLLRHRGLAEEVLQETFLQAWLQAGNYRPELGTPRGWLLLLARSRALDCLRRETSRSRREETLSPPQGTVKSRVRLGMRKLGGMLGIQPA